MIPGGGATKAWICGRPLSVAAGSNSAGWNDVSLLCVCVCVVR